MSKHAVPTTGARRRFSPIVIAAGVAAALALSLSFSNTLSAFTAAITNTDNTANSVSIKMSEGPDANTSTCATGADGTATCSTDLYQGSNLRPGNTGPVNTAVFKNTGGVAAQSFTLKPGTCIATSSQSNSLCNYLLVTITIGTGATKQTVVNGATASSIAGATYSSPTPPAAGATDTATVQVTLDPNAPNTAQAQTLTQSLVWTFTA